MYSRRIGDETLAFGHEGILYKRSFIMYDRSTQSLWVHVSGEAIKGKRKGQQLKFLPSVITTWGDWKMRHLHTTVLEGRKARGMMGDYRLKRELGRFGLSVGDGKQVRLYPFPILKERPVLLDTFGGKPVVVVFDAQTTVARAFRSGGRKLARKGDVLVDDKGGAWDWFTGLPKNAKAELALEAVPATVWLTDRWKAHNPEGEIYAPKK